MSEILWERSNVGKRCSAEFLKWRGGLTISTCLVNSSKRLSLWSYIGFYISRAVRKGTMSVVYVWRVMVVVLGNRVVC